MTNATEARRLEIARFIVRHPDATTSSIVDHMVEKFPEFGRHVFRADIQRMPDEVLSRARQEVLKARKRASTPRSKQKAPETVRKRPKVQAVEIPLEDTQRRQARVLELYEGPSRQRTLLRSIQKEFPTAPEPATLAMIVQVVRAEGDHEQYPAHMEKLFGVAVCPTCTKTAHGVDEIYVHFGLREKNKRRQSYCRVCRKTQGKK